MTVAVTIRGRYDQCTSQVARHATLPTRNRALMVVGTGSRSQAREDKALWSRLGRGRGTDPHLVPARRPGTSSRRAVPALRPGARSRCVVSTRCPNASSQSHVSAARLSRSSHCDALAVQVLPPFSSARKKSGGENMSSLPVPSLSEKCTKPRKPRNTACPELWYGRRRQPRVHPKRISPADRTVFSR